MDTSEEYIKMCQKATEVQALCEADVEIESPSIWLPRQDQLQGMVEYTVGVNKFNSMEQLWLAFVMSEKYNKKWDGKDWIKKRG